MNGVSKCHGNTDLYPHKVLLTLRTIFRFVHRTCTVLQKRPNRTNRPKVLNIPSRPIIPIILIIRIIQIRPNKQNRPNGLIRPIRPIISIREI